MRCASGRHRRPAPGGCGYLKEAAVPTSVRDEKQALRLIEADIANADTSDCGKGQATLFDHQVAHVFDDIGDRPRTGPRVLRRNRLRDGRGVCRTAGRVAL